MAVAVALTSRRLSKRGAESGVTLDIALWAIPFGIVGARVYHVLTHLDDYFFAGANLWEVFAIWNGGIALYGSLIGGSIGAYVGTRRAGIRFWSFADALAPGLLIAQALGRLGNYFNHELFGLPTTLPWGLEISPTAPMFPDGLPEDTLFHPLFLYEILWNLVGVGLLLLIERRFQLRWGRSFALYLIWYGLGRSWLEAIRIDPSSEAPLGIPMNIWTSLIAIAVGVAILIVQTRRHPEPETSVYRHGIAPAAYWEGRYAEAGPVWSGKANQRLVEVATMLAPGRALDLGCGEGADAIWLARRGWCVTGIDISPTAIARARAAALSAGLTADQVSFNSSDLSTWTSDEQYDLVAASFLHSPVALSRTDILRGASSAVAPGGHLLILSHVAFPPWSNVRGDHDHHFLTPAEETESLSLVATDWEVRIAETRPRSVVGPNGEAATLEDAIVLLRRH